MHISDDIRRELNAKIREIAGDNFVEIPPEVSAEAVAGNPRPLAAFLAADIRRRGW